MHRGALGGRGWGFFLLVAYTRSNEQNLAKSRCEPVLCQAVCWSTPAPGIVLYRLWVVSLTESIHQVFYLFQDLANIGPAYDNQKQNNAVSTSGSLNGKFFWSGGFWIFGTKLYFPSPIAGCLCSYIGWDAAVKVVVWTEVTLIMVKTRSASLTVSF